jgi:type VI secretion system protein
MALRLRVVSEQRRALGDRATIVVGVGGISIGRAADNDWVLPDPNRYLSGSHARIDFRDGSYYLEDTSTNGVFLDDSEVPLAEQGPYCLRNGDLLRLGDYEIIVTSVSVEPGVDAILAHAVLPAANLPPPGPPGPPGPSDPAESVIVHRVESLEGTGRSAHTDIGASLNLQALFDPSPSDRFRALSPLGNVVPSPIGADVPEPEGDPDAVARRLTRLARSVNRNRGTSTPTPAFYDVQTGLAAFCRGAGIDASRLPVDAQTRMLHLAGQLFREALVGLRDLHHYHQELRGALQIEIPLEDDPTRPSLARGGVEELAEHLLQSHDSRRVDAVQWLRAAFEAAKTHDSAQSAATQAAFADFVLKLDPDDLEARFARKGDCWELYREFYRNLCEMPTGGLPHVFIDAFARGYLEYIKSLAEPSDS